ncbi:hypothetical protein ACS0TY_026473 [Phlomoides rotata]
METANSSSSSFNEVCCLDKDVESSAPILEFKTRIPMNWKKAAREKKERRWNFHHVSKRPDGNFTIWKRKLLMRGLGKMMKRNDIKNGNDMYCIQESKIEKIEDNIGRDIWFDSDFDWAWREAEGRLGGIISIWNRKAFSKISSWHMKGMLVVNGIWRDDDAKVMIINVYAPCIVSEK